MQITSNLLVPIGSTFPSILQTRLKVRFRVTKEYRRKIVYQSIKDNRNCRTKGLAAKLSICQKPIVLKTAALVSCEKLLRLIARKNEIRVPF